MKPKTAETPILMRYGEGDYVNRAKGPWSCEECITDYYEGDLRRISIVFSTKPSDNAVAIRVRAINPTSPFASYVNFCRHKGTPDQCLYGAMDKFLLRHFAIPEKGSLTLYYTVYER